MALLSINNDAKTVKGTQFGILTGIMYLAPSDTSGFNVCPFSSEGCRKACLYFAGRGAFQNVQRARVNKTVWFAKDQVGFLRQLIKEINALVKRAAKEGKVSAVRLNGTSDIPWEQYQVDGKNIMEHFPHVQFYDYTKNPFRMASYVAGRLPSNYHLTFSRSETNQALTEQVIQEGGNVAVVFRGGLPTEYLGRPVIDGDISDIRFNDPQGCIVGLKAKGRARKAEGDFVVQV